MPRVGLVVTCRQSRIRSVRVWSFHPATWHGSWLPGGGLLAEFSVRGERMRSNGTMAAVDCDASKGTRIGAVTSHPAMATVEEGLGDGGDGQAPRCQRLVC